MNFDAFPLLKKIKGECNRTKMDNFCEPATFPYLDYK